VARGCRLQLVQSVDRQLGPFDRRLLDAVLEVPRERFVRREDVARSADDTPLGLDSAGLASISAPHAYLLSYRLLDLAPGDTLVELGTGSGYGAALAAFVLGAAGRVTTFEIDPDLVALARACLADPCNVEVVERDAMVSAPAWNGARKVSVTFAVAALPSAWLDALPRGGKLVAPVGPKGAEQRLLCVSKDRAGRMQQTDHGSVRYVANRSAR
jgi:protein-L-isoaspartate(D-aspartate) O-methyltransferase